MKNLIITLCFALCASSFITAQDGAINTASNNSKWDLGIGFGLSNSGTDTHSWGRHGVSFTENANLAWNANIKYHFSNAISLRLDYLGSKLAGSSLITVL